MRKVSPKSLALALSLMPMVGFILSETTQGTPSLPDTGGEVFSVLTAHCSPCHTGKQAAGNLSLNSYESLINSKVLRLGSTNKPILIERLLGLDGKPRMPMGFKPLLDENISLIQEWIRQGAKPPRNLKRVHWAFVNPKRPPVPKLSANPIDAFVLARLKREGLKPSPAADRSTLIRRVTLDLIGLPPTPAEILAFLADKSPNAYEKVVDRLLASPHYGERMALPWLDAARYADSNGFQQDGDTFQYVWRDWVVKALNANMPFDQFTIEQLAGDLLPKPTLDQFVATAFNRNHMLNGEGGAIPEEQRNVNLFDRVDTTSATWLSLTMGCARCHDHKYDPLTQKDYYAMMAYFNRVPETGVPAGSGQYRIADPWIYAGNPAQMAALRQAEAAVALAKKAESSFQSRPDFEIAFQKWRAQTTDALENSKVSLTPWRDLGTYTKPSFDEAFATNFDPEKGLTAKSTLRTDLLDGVVNQLTGDYSAFYFQREITSSRETPYLLSLGSDDGIRVFLNGKLVFSRKVNRAATPDSDRVVVQLKEGGNVLLLKIVNGGGPGGFYFQGFAGGVDDRTASIIKSLKPADQTQLKEAFLTVVPSDEVKALRQKTAKAEARLAEIKQDIPRVMVMSDAMPRTTHILNRGNYEEPTDAVEPATPNALPKAMGPKNRLGLARWIVSPNNPLTARVQVNRVWQLFFGRGLVRTEENFGVKGEPPTHPELLDWLAVDLRENGWNMKRLNKMIVMSNTYRQSSKITRDALKKDPANLYFARASRFRLPSMILRDVALTASGLLDRRIGGKPVYPYQPKGIWDGLAITLERDFTYPQSTGTDNYRRSLYTFWRRTVAPGNMFDSGSRQVCTVKPTLTSTPLHALTMLNDITWVEAGNKLAEAVLTKGTDDQRLASAFFRVCSRNPRSDEIATLKRALNRARDSFRADPKAAEAYLSQGYSQPLNKTPDLAALGAVCTAILNLDEAITRE